VGADIRVGYSKRMSGKRENHKMVHEKGEEQEHKGFECPSHSAMKNSQK